MKADRLNFITEISLSEEKLRKINKKLVILDINQKEYENELEKLFKFTRTCSRLKKSYPRLEKLLSKISTKKTPKVGLTEIEIERIESDLLNFDKLRSEIIDGLKYFIYEGIIHDDNKILQDAPRNIAVHNTFIHLQKIFNDLPHEKNILNDQVKTHNSSVSQYTKDLEDQGQHIANFISQLNQDFEKVAINDLDKVEVKIQIDRRFKNLVEEIKKIDLYSNKPLSTRFYDRLTNFVREFFKDENDTHLTMERIIVGLSYRTMKTGSNNWQDKDQSDSTTSLINLELVQLLLSRIKKAGCYISFPLVHDELANVNLDQFDWLLPHLKEQGFNLFAAGTESTSGELLFKIKNIHKIGRARTAHPYHKTRTKVYWGRAEQFLSTEEAISSNISIAKQPSLDL